MRKWFIIVGYFLIMTILFLIFDGTPLIKSFELGDFGEKMLQTKIFTEWFNFYENPFFNIVTFFAVLHILMTGLYDVLFKRRGVDN